VLRGLFQAVIEDVRRLVGIDKQAAAAKVAGAEKLGERLRKWLETGGGETKATQIENVQYDLAELDMAIADYDRAVGLYEAIVGTAFPPPEPLRIEGIFGLARCYEALADKNRDAKQAETLYNKAFGYWKLLLDVESGTVKDKDVQRIWLYRYHSYRCMAKVGKKDEVREGLKYLEVISKPQPLGGNDPVLQKKFTDLKAEVAGGK